MSSAPRSQELVVFARVPAHVLRLLDTPDIREAVPVARKDLRLPGLAGSGWATLACHVGSVVEGFDLTGYLPFQAAN